MVFLTNGIRGHLVFMTQNATGRSTFADLVNRREKKSAHRQRNNLRKQLVS
jgi:hypothetical protein